MIKDNIFQTTKVAILTITLFLFPFFFLPTTQEYFVTNKMYLLAITSLILLSISTFELLKTGRIKLPKSLLDLFILLFIASFLTSILISSPNKIEAILMPNFGLLSLLSLYILTIYLSRSQIIILPIISLSSILLSLITIIFFFHPFKNINLPLYLQFLRNESFTPVGNLLDLVILLGFFALSHVTKLLVSTIAEKQSLKEVLGTVLAFSINIVAIMLILIKLNSVGIGPLPPFRLSWFAALETLKNPLTAIFGVGIDNFASLFTRVKDLGYNQTSLWQIQSFNVARSTFLHVFTEAGLFGFISFILLVGMLVKKAFQKHPIMLLLASYPLIVFSFFPPSLPVFFLLFLFLATIEESKTYQFTLGRSLRVIGVFLLIALTFAFFLLAKTYLAEYNFKQSLNAIVQNDLKKSYEEQKKAVTINPYIERYRLNFSNTNITIANTLATQKENISKEDRETIGKAIQAAIAEGKAAVRLNPQKASNWYNIATIYNNLISAVQNADAWTISSYQRAIVLDPQNPSLRLELGRVYYTRNNFDEAKKYFEQAVSLKPDWPNAYYNLAWSNFQKGDPEKAIESMQIVLKLVDPKKAITDYEKAKKDLESFKKIPTKE